MEELLLGAGRMSHSQLVHFRQTLVRLRLQPRKVRVLKLQQVGPRRHLHLRPQELLVELKEAVAAQAQAQAQAQAKQLLQ
jgi:hypothetical protein